MSSVQQIQMLLESGDFHVDRLVREAIVKTHERKEWGTIYFLTQKRENEYIQIGRFQAIHSHICEVTSRLYENFQISQPLKNLCATHPPGCLSVFVIFKFHFLQLDSVL